MRIQLAQQISRRRFLGGLTLAGTTGLLGLPARRAAAEPPPETSTLTLLNLRVGDDVGVICYAPLYVAEELLRAEGFSDVQYVPIHGTAAGEKALASGEVDLCLGLSIRQLLRLDAGDPIVVLAGGHVGCFELFTTPRVRDIRDLKGKTVAVVGLGSGPHVFLSTMLAYVGIDPRKDVNWVTHPFEASVQLLADGQIDAWMAFPPEPQVLRARGIGRVVVNTAVDRPWAHYFCCVVTAHREFVTKHPVATKRALRAILKAADVCTQEPGRVAQLLVDKGHTTSYEYSREAMQEIPYDHWRRYDLEDTLRFFALRLHELGMIRSTPQKLIAQGTDGRFLNELKKELKG
jgi:NitT/TauT family transport system substrate-binding protein